MAYKSQGLRHPSDQQEFLAEAEEIPLAEMERKWFRQRHRLRELEYWPEAEPIRSGLQAGQRCRQLP